MSARSAPVPLVVGFDLDMTLIDPRRSIRSALGTVIEETGVPVDVELVIATLGPPLETALSPWFAGDDLERACRLFREVHGTLLTTQTEAMPGALDAVAIVRARGGKAVVVTAKYEAHAVTSLEAVGIVVDAVVGWRYGAAKGEALREHGAQVYVGDHPADVVAAHVGGAISVAVATGGTAGTDLRAAGAEVVLPDLVAFPAWLHGWMDRASSAPR